MAWASLTDPHATARHRGPEWLFCALEGVAFQISCPAMYDPHGHPPRRSLGLSSYNWWSEATHGVESNGGRSFPTTNFAFPITTAMSFNRSLWRATGAQIGREARAAMNAGAGYSTFWAPVINLAREPRWARNIETPGEDPYLSGEYATAFVRGFQVCIVGVQAIAQ